MTNLSYKGETQRKLDIRIRAHKAFANFDIDEWIERFVDRRPRRAILDLGCGNGNHLGMYLEHVGPGGTVTGIDHEPSLVEAARRRYGSATNLDLRVGSMDDPLPFEAGAFDLCLSNFAFYYVVDPRRTLTEIHRVLAPGGEVVLIGPTRNNAREIYEFNERLTGEAIDPITAIRTDRLHQEILPILREVFGTATEEVINSFLTFPTKRDFIEYFMATIVYEEGALKLGKTEADMMAALDRERSIVLSKEMVALVARRS